MTMTDWEDRQKMAKFFAALAAIVVLFAIIGTAHAGQGKVIGSRPAGCPHRFCGCALSLKLFGRIVPDLNLAANWKRKFPRTQPRPGAVAARSGHVFQLVQQVSGNRWIVWDPNSGGGKIRIHERRVTGYTFHDPFASRLAMVRP